MLVAGVAARSAIAPGLSLAWRSALSSRLTRTRRRCSASNSTPTGSAGSSTRSKLPLADLRRRRRCAQSAQIDADLRGGVDRADRAAPARARPPSRRRRCASSRSTLSLTMRISWRCAGSVGVLGEQRVGLRDRRQRVADLVRDAGRDAAHRGELFLAAARLHVAHVLEKQHAELLARLRLAPPREAHAHPQRSPVLGNSTAVTARAAAAQAPGLVATVLAAMPAELQRGAGSLACGMARRHGVAEHDRRCREWLADSLADLEIDADAMVRNLRTLTGLA